MLLAILCCPCGAVQKESYGRSWWLHTPEDERAEFVSGYVDCSDNEIGGKSWGKNFTFEELVESMTRYYVAHKSTNLSVPELARYLAPRQKHVVTHPGDYHPGKHGIYDGVYWAEAGPDGRFGFIEGYEECQRLHNTSPGKYRFNPRQQVTQINQWYGISDSGSTGAHQDRIGDKIADVLARFEK